MPLLCVETPLSYETWAGCLGILPIFRGSRESMWMFDEALSAKKVVEAGKKEQRSDTEAEVALASAGTRVWTEAATRRVHGRLPTTVSPTSPCCRWRSGAAAGQHCNAHSLIRRCPHSRLFTCVLCDPTRRSQSSTRSTGPVVPRQLKISLGLTSCGKQASALTSAPLWVFRSKPSGGHSTPSAQGRRSRAEDSKTKRQEERPRTQGRCGTGRACR